MAQLKRILGVGFHKRRRVLPTVHGTVCAYVHRGCRCDACRKANREYRRGVAAKQSGIPRHLHGRHGTYTYLGCRCEVCRTAATEYRRKFKRTRAFESARVRAKG